MARKRRFRWPPEPPPVYRRPTRPPPEVEGRKEASFVDPVLLAADLRILRSRMNRLEVLADEAGSSEERRRIIDEWRSYRAEYLARKGDLRDEGEGEDGQGSSGNGGVG